MDHVLQKRTLEILRDIGWVAYAVPKDHITWVDLRNRRHCLCEPKMRVQLGGWLWTGVAATQGRDTREVRG